MLKRKFYNKLLEWKNHDNGRSAFLIDGARRVGKSYLAKLFGEQEYQSYILIDFAHLPAGVMDTFQHDATNFDLFFNKLSLIYKTKLYRRNSLIIFDEVQLYPPARQLIKYLVQDGRYDYLETGSLISLRQNINDIVIPSEEIHYELYPLDFEEYLWANSDDITFDCIRESFNTLTPLSPAIHQRVMSDFRQYLVVGGMPQVVNTYIETHDFAEVDKIKKQILKLYRNDVTKFAPGNEARILAIFDNIPGQLSKKDKHYSLAVLGNEARLRTYNDAFVWLQEAMIVNSCFNATDPTVGLNLSLDHTTRKYYFADTGLLITHTFMDNDYLDNDFYRQILLDKLNINEGMLMENIVAQALRCSGHRLFFYSRTNANDRKNEIEIDFIIKRGTKICPVEVKSGQYQKHASLDKFREKFGSHLGQAIILYTKDLMIKDGIWHRPLYMAGLL